MKRQSEVELIKSRLQPSSVIREFVKLAKKGKYLYGLCPFHKEKTPSFTVSDEKGFFCCFGCGVKGDVFSFIMQIKKVSFYEALTFCAAKAGIQIEKSQPDHKTLTNPDDSVMTQAKNWFIKQLNNHSKAKKYLLDRFKDPELIRKFELGYDPSIGGLVEYLESRGCHREKLQTLGLMNARGKDCFASRVIFPIKDDNGTVIAFGGRNLNARGPKYLNSPESELFKKREVLYGLDLALPAIRESSSVIVVEGYTDVLALHHYGFRNVVASLGTAITAFHLLKLLSHANHVTFCFDGDEAGFAAVKRVIKIALPVVTVDSNISFALIQGAKDPYDLLQEAGREGFAKLLLRAWNLSEFIWNVESGATSLDLPESQAQLEKALMQYVDLIKDRDLRKYYRLYFIRRIRECGYKNWRGVNIRYIPDIKLDHEYLIVRIMIDFPEMLNLTGVQEQFTDFDLNECCAIQGLIIEAWEETDCSKESIEAKIEDSGLADLLLKIRNYTKNYCINNLGDAELLWKRILTLSEIDALEAEYRHLVEGAMEKEDDMDRAVAILEIILQLKNRVRMYDFN